MSASRPQSSPQSLEGGAFGSSFPTTPNTNTRRLNNLINSAMTSSSSSNNDEEADGVDQHRTISCDASGGVEWGSAQDANSTFKNGGGDVVFGTSDSSNPFPEGVLRPSSRALSRVLSTGSRTNSDMRGMNSRPPSREASLTISHSSPNQAPAPPLRSSSGLDFGTTPPAIVPRASTPSTRITMGTTDDNDAAPPPVQQQQQRPSLSQLARPEVVAGSPLASTPASALPASWALHGDRPPRPSKPPTATANVSPTYSSTTLANNNERNSQSPDWTSTSNPPSNPTSNPHTTTHSLRTTATGSSTLPPSSAGEGFNSNSILLSTDGMGRRQRTGSGPGAFSSDAVNSGETASPNPLDASNSTPAPHPNLASVLSPAFIVGQVEYGHVTANRGSLTASTMDPGSAELTEFSPAIASLARSPQNNSTNPNSTSGGGGGGGSASPIPQPCSTTQIHSDSSSPSAVVLEGDLEGILTSRRGHPVTSSAPAPLDAHPHTSSRKLSNTSESMASDSQSRLPIPVSTKTNLASMNSFASGTGGAPLSRSFTIAPHEGACSVGNSKDMSFPSSPIHAIRSVLGGNDRVQSPSALSNINRTTSVTVVTPTDKETVLTFPIIDSAEQPSHPGRLSVTLPPPTVLPPTVSPIPSPGSSPPHHVEEVVIRIDNSDKSLSHRGSDSYASGGSPTASKKRSSQTTDPDAPTSPSPTHSRRSSGNSVGAAGSSTSAFPTAADPATALQDDVLPQESDHLEDDLLEVVRKIDEVKEYIEDRAMSQIEEAAFILRNGLEVQKASVVQTKIPTLFAGSDQLPLIPTAVSQAGVSMCESTMSIPLNTPGATSTAVESGSIQDEAGNKLGLEFKIVSFSLGRSALYNSGKGQRESEFLMSLSASENQLFPSLKYPHTDGATPTASPLKSRGSHPFGDLPLSSTTAPQLTAKQVELSGFYNYYQTSQQELQPHTPPPLPKSYTHPTSSNTQYVLYQAATAPLLPYTRRLRPYLRDPRDFYAALVYGWGSYSVGYFTSYSQSSIHLSRSKSVSTEGATSSQGVFIHTPQSSAPSQMTLGSAISATATSTVITPVSSIAAASAFSFGAAIHAPVPLIEEKQDIITKALHLISVNRRRMDHAKAAVVLSQSGKGAMPSFLSTTMRREDTQTAPYMHSTTHLAEQSEEHRNNNNNNPMASFGGGIGSGSTGSRSSDMIPPPPIPAASSPKNNSGTRRIDLESLSASSVDEANPSAASFIGSQGTYRRCLKALSYGYCVPSTTAYFLTTAARHVPLRRSNTNNTGSGGGGRYSPTIGGGDSSTSTPDEGLHDQEQGYLLQAASMACYHLHSSTSAAGAMAHKIIVKHNRRMRQECEEASLIVERLREQEMRMKAASPNNINNVKAVGISIFGASKGEWGVYSQSPSHTSQAAHSPWLSNASMGSNVSPEESSGAVSMSGGYDSSAMRIMGASSPSGIARKPTFTSVQQQSPQPDLFSIDALVKLVEPASVVYTPSMTHSRHHTPSELDTSPRMTNGGPSESPVVPPVLGNDSFPALQLGMPLNKSVTIPTYGVGNMQTAFPPSSSGGIDSRPSAGQESSSFPDGGTTNSSEGVLGVEYSPSTIRAALSLISPFTPSQLSFYYRYKDAILATDPEVSQIMSFGIEPNEPTHRLEMVCAKSILSLLKGSTPSGLSSISQYRLETALRSRYWSHNNLLKEMADIEMQQNSTVAQLSEVVTRVEFVRMSEGASMDSVVIEDVQRMDEMLVQLRVIADKMEVLSQQEEAVLADMHALHTPLIAENTTTSHVAELTKPRRRRRRVVSQKNTTGSQDPSSNNTNTNAATGSPYNNRSPAHSFARSDDLEDEKVYALCSNITTHVSHVLDRQKPHLTSLRAAYESAAMGTGESADSLMGYMKRNDAKKEHSSHTSDNGESSSSSSSLPVPSVDSLCKPYYTVHPSTCEKLLPFAIRNVIQCGSLLDKLRRQAVGARDGHFGTPPPLEHRQGTLPSHASKSSNPSSPTAARSAETIAPSTRRDSLVSRSRSGNAPTSPLSDANNNNNNLLRVESTLSPSASTGSAMPSMDFNADSASSSAADAQALESWSAAHHARKAAIRMDTHRTEEIRAAWTELVLFLLQRCRPKFISGVFPAIEKVLLHPTAMRDFDLGSSQEDVRSVQSNGGGGTSSQLTTSGSPSQRRLQRPPFANSSTGLSGSNGDATSFGSDERLSLDVKLQMADLHMLLTSEADDDAVIDFVLSKRQGIRINDTATEKPISRRASRNVVDSAPPPRDRDYDRGLVRALIVLSAERALGAPASVNHFHPPQLGSSPQLRKPKSPNDTRTASNNHSHSGVFGSSSNVRVPWGFSLANCVDPTSANSEMYHLASIQKLMHAHRQSLLRGRLINPNGSFPIPASSNPSNSTPFVPPIVMEALERVPDIRLQQEHIAKALKTLLESQGTPCDLGEEQEMCSHGGGCGRTSVVEEIVPHMIVGDGGGEVDSEERGSMAAHASSTPPPDRELTEFVRLGSRPKIQTTSLPQQTHHNQQHQQHNSPHSSLLRDESRRVLPHIVTDAYGNSIGTLGAYLSTNIPTAAQCDSCIVPSTTDMHTPGPSSSQGAGIGAMPNAKDGGVSSSSNYYYTGVLEVPKSRTILLGFIRPVVSGITNRGKKVDYITPAYSSPLTAKVPVRGASVTHTGYSASMSEMDVGRTKSRLGPLDSNSEADNNTVIAMDSQPHCSLPTLVGDGIYTLTALDPTATMATQGGSALKRRGSVTFTSASKKSATARSATVNISENALGRDADVKVGVRRNALQVSLSRLFPCWGVQVDQMVPSYREHSHLLGSGDAALFPCYDSQLTCATLLRDIAPKQQSSSPNQQQPPSSPTTTATKRNPHSSLTFLHYLHKRSVRRTACMKRILAQRRHTLLSANNTVNLSGGSGGRNNNARRVSDVPGGLQGMLSPHRSMINSGSIASDASILIGGGSRSYRVLSDESIGSMGFRTGTSTPASHATAATFRRQDLHPGSSNNKVCERSKAGLAASLQSLGGLSSLLSGSEESAAQGRILAARMLGVVVSLPSTASSDMGRGFGVVSSRVTSMYWEDVLDLLQDGHEAVRHVASRPGVLGAFLGAGSRAMNTAVLPRALLSVVSADSPSMLSCFVETLCKSNLRSLCSPQLLRSVLVPFLSAHASGMQAPLASGGRLAAHGWPMGELVAVSPQARSTLSPPLALHPHLSRQFGRIMIHYADSVQFMKLIRTFEGFTNSPTDYVRQNAVFNLPAVAIAVTRRQSQLLLHYLLISVLRVTVSSDGVDIDQSKVKKYPLLISLLEAALRHELWLMRDPSGSSLSDVASLLSATTIPALRSCIQSYFERVSGIHEASPISYTTTNSSPSSTLPSSLTSPKSAPPSTAAPQQQPIGPFDPISVPLSSPGSANAWLIFRGKLLGLPHLILSSISTTIMLVEALSSAPRLRDLMEVVSMYMDLISPPSKDSINKPNYVVPPMVYTEPNYDVCDSLKEFLKAVRGAPNTYPLSHPSASVSMTTGSYLVVDSTRSALKSPRNNGTINDKFGAHVSAVGPPPVTQLPFSCGWVKDRVVKFAADENPVVRRIIAHTVHELSTISFKSHVLLTTLCLQDVPTMPTHSRDRLDRIASAIRQSLPSQSGDVTLGSSPSYSSLSLGGHRSPAPGSPGAPVGGGGDKSSRIQRKVSLTLAGNRRRSGGFGSKSSAVGQSASGGLGSRSGGLPSSPNKTILVPGAFGPHTGAILTSSSPVEAVMASVNNLLEDADPTVVEACASRIGDICNEVEFVGEGGHVGISSIVCDRLSDFYFGLVDNCNGLSQNTSPPRSPGDSNPLVDGRSTLRKINVDNDHLSTGGNGGNNGGTYLSGYTTLAGGGVDTNSSTTSNQHQRQRRGGAVCSLDLLPPTRTYLHPFTDVDQTAFPSTVSRHHRTQLLKKLMTVSRNMLSTSWRKSEGVFGALAPHFTTAPHSLLLQTISTPPSVLNNMSSMSIAAIREGTYKPSEGFSPRSAFMDDGYGHVNVFGGLGLGDYDDSAMSEVDREARQCGEKGMMYTSNGLAVGGWVESDHDITTIYPDGCGTSSEYSSGRGRQLVNTRSILVLTDPYVWSHGVGDTSPSALSGDAVTAVNAPPRQTPGVMVLAQSNKPPAVLEDTLLPMKSYHGQPLGITPTSAAGNGNPLSSSSPSFSPQQQQKQPVHNPPQVYPFNIHSGTLKTSHTSASSLPLLNLILALTSICPLPYYHFLTDSSLPSTSATPPSSPPCITPTTSVLLPPLLTGLTALMQGGRAQPGSTSGASSQSMSADIVSPMSAIVSAASSGGMSTATPLTVVYPNAPNAKSLLRARFDTDNMTLLEGITNLWMMCIDKCIHDPSPHVSATTNPTMSATSPYAVISEWAPTSKRLIECQHALASRIPLGSSSTNISSTEYATRVITLGMSHIRTCISKEVDRVMLELPRCIAREASRDSEPNQITTLSSNRPESSPPPPPLQRPLLANVPRPTMSVQEIHETFTASLFFKELVVGASQARGFWAGMIVSLLRRASIEGGTLLSRRNDDSVLSKLNYTQPTSEAHHGDGPGSPLRGLQMPKAARVNLIQYTGAQSLANAPPSSSSSQFNYYSIVVCQILFGWLTLLPPPPRRTTSTSSTQSKHQHPTPHLKAIEATDMLLFPSYTAGVYLRAPRGSFSSPTELSRTGLGGGIQRYPFGEGNTANKRIAFLVLAAEIARLDAPFVSFLLEDLLTEVAFEKDPVVGVRRALIDATSAFSPHLACIILTRVVLAEHEPTLFRRASAALEKLKKDMQSTITTLLVAEAVQDGILNKLKTNHDIHLHSLGQSDSIRNEEDQAAVDALAQASLSSVSSKGASSSEGTISKHHQNVHQGNVGPNQQRFSSILCQNPHLLVLPSSRSTETDSVVKVLKSSASRASELPPGATIPRGASHLEGVLSLVNQCCQTPPCRLQITTPTSTLPPRLAEDLNKLYFTTRSVLSHPVGRGSGGGGTRRSSGQGGSEGGSRTGQGGVGDILWMPDLVSDFKKAGNNRPSPIVVIAGQDSSSTVGAPSLLKIGSTTTGDEEDDDNNNTDRGNTGGGADRIDIVGALEVLTVHTSTFHTHLPIDIVTVKGVVPEEGGAQKSPTLLSLAAFSRSSVINGAVGGSGGGGVSSLPPEGVTDAILQLKYPPQEELAGGSAATIAKTYSRWVDVAVNRYCDAHPTAHVYPSIDNCTSEGTTSSNNNNEGFISNGALPDANNPLSADSSSRTCSTVGIFGSSGATSGAGESILTPLVPEQQQQQPPQRQQSVSFRDMSESSPRGEFFTSDDGCISDTNDNSRASSPRARVAVRSTSNIVSFISRRSNQSGHTPPSTLGSSTPLPIASTSFGDTFTNAVQDAVSFATSVDHGGGGAPVGLRERMTSMSYMSMASDRVGGGKLQAAWLEVPCVLLPTSLPSTTTTAAAPMAAVPKSGITKASQCAFTGLGPLLYHQLCRILQPPHQSSSSAHPVAE